MDYSTCLALHSPIIHPAKVLYISIRSICYLHTAGCPTYESPRPAHEVDPAAAGEVHHAHQLEHALLRPQPAGGQAEHEGVEHREENVEVEVCPLRDCSGNYRRS